jgi:hypothetical protein
MRMFWLMPALIGCANKASPCISSEAEAWPDDVFVLDRPDGEPFQVQVHPSTASDTEASAPMVVFIHGGWGSEPLPITDQQPQLRSDLGYHVLYLELPADDLRGAASRATLATALRYASSLPDAASDTDCANPSEEGTQRPVLLAGFSHGGNLAWSTLADPTLDLPEIAGIATFETPPSSQFVAVDVGTLARPNDRFNEDECSSVESEIICEIDYTPMVAVTCATDASCLVIDANHDGQLSDGEFVLGTLNDPVSGMRVASLQAVAAAEAAGVLPDTFMGATAVADFWSERLGPEILQRAAHRHPLLGAIVTGTERDHMLTALRRPVHLTNMAAAITQAGVGWVRLHPDAAYLQFLHGDILHWKDYPANEGTDLSDRTLSAEPEETGAIHPTDYLDAAVLELIDRSRTGDWSNDLDEPIQLIP